MTSLVVWVAVDQRGPASAYIATDSRISWLNTQSSAKWDNARKTYATQRSADLIGYVGDVLYPSQALPAIIARLDEMQPAVTVDEAQDRVLKLVEAAWRNVPPETRAHRSELVHCTRVGSGMRCEFGAQVLRLPAGERQWSTVKLPIPTISSKLEFLGSGTRSLKAAHAEWIRPNMAADDQRRTSRAIFTSFCESVRSGVDRFSGGAPQLVGMYRVGPGRSYGIRWDGETYRHGSPLDQEPPADVQFYNSCFERVDYEGRLLDGAQRHSPIQSR